jgi:L-cysteine desulfidase
MIEESLRSKIISLIKREVVPAMGCTEPVAVALAVARATELCGCNRDKVDSIVCRLSANIVKNAMGVGIPGTGMIGLPIAVALGVLVGKSDYCLEVLRDVDDNAVARGKQLIERGIISIELEENAPDVLYIDARVSGEGHSARAVIEGGHSNFVKLERDGEDVRVSGASEAADGGECCDECEVDLTLRTVWEFATETPLDELTFILETRRLNKAAAEWALMDPYGHHVGRTLHSERQRRVMGDSTFSRILSYTSAACDARMGGAPVAVMSNSGSGNQGIAATMPVVIYAEENYANEEQTVRALALSHLTAIYIKQSLGRLSALCGCVVAATGSSAGICYLMGGDYDRVAATVKNMVANLTGMICDGAKPSCALKLTSGVSTAVISAMVAMEGESASSLEGIIDEDVDRTIRNLTTIGREGMTQTDRLILNIMTSKHD